MEATSKDAGGDWGVIDAAGRLAPLRLVEKDSDAAREATSVGASCVGEPTIRAQGGNSAGWENDNLGPLAETIVNLTRLWTRTGPDAQDACALLQAVTGAMMDA
jgi:hypothetical protein